MFSANENLALRKHKRRVVQFVEDCIPDFALDAGEKNLHALLLKMKHQSIVVSSSIPSIPLR